MGVGDDATYLLARVNSDVNSELEGPVGAGHAPPTPAHTGPPRSLFTLL